MQQLKNAGNKKENKKIENKIIKKGQNVIKQIASNLIKKQCNIFLYN